MEDNKHQAGKKLKRWAPSHDRATYCYVDRMAVFLNGKGPLSTYSILSYFRASVLQ